LSRLSKASSRARSDDLTIWPGAEERYPTSSQYRPR
jgi:hypothetical protein